MRTQYSRDQTVMKIWGDHSPHEITISTEMLISEFNGDHVAAFHTLKRWRSQNRLASMGIMDGGNMQYTRDNVSRGERYWQWINHSPDWRNLYWGYAHIDRTLHTATFTDGREIHYGK